MAVKCFDIVNMVVEEANEQFGKLWKVNEENYKILKQYCEAMDVLAKEHDGEAFDVEIDDIAMTITIGMECMDFVVQNKKSLYYELVKRAVSFGFSAAEDGNLLVRFTFPSIWEKA